MGPENKEFPKFSDSQVFYPDFRVSRIIFKCEISISSRMRRYLDTDKSVEINFIDLAYKLTVFFRKCSRIPKLLKICQRAI